jgi:hypothetical protein
MVGISCQTQEICSTQSLIVMFPIFCACAFEGRFGGIDFSSSVWGSVSFLRYKRRLTIYYRFLQLRSLALPFTVMEWALPPVPRSAAAAAASARKSTLLYRDRPTIASAVAAANAPLLSPTSPSTSGKWQFWLLFWLLLSHWIGIWYQNQWSAHLVASWEMFLEFLFVLLSMHHGAREDMEFSTVWTLGLPVVQPVTSVSTIDPLGCGCCMKNTCRFTSRVRVCRKLCICSGQWFPRCFWDARKAGSWLQV